MELEFRRATAADCAALARLVNSAYRGESSKQGWTTEADLLGGQRTSAALLAAELEQPGLEQMLAFDESGRLVGTYRWEPDPDGSTDGYVGMITVEPTLQGAGLGRALIADAERRTREHGCPGLVMWVIAQRDELRAFYARCGYRDTGRRAPFPYGYEQFGIPKRADLEFAILRKPLA